MISRKRIYDLSERFTDSLLHRAAALAFPGRGAPLPPVLVIALPKSGSIYLQRALRRTLRVPIHHIAGGGMSGSTFRHADLLRFGQGNVVSREHLQPRAFSLNVLASHGVKRAVLHLRDPRAAIVSWARHMDRVLVNRGLRAVELSCEMAVPDAYADWAFDQRLHWQVENKLPQFVQWITDWLQLVDASREVEFLVTDHAALNDDAGALVARILEFHGIAYQPDWITLPKIRIGKNNMFTLPEPPVPGAAPAWARQMAPETLRAADALVPADLIDRLGWDRLGRTGSRRMQD